MRSSDIEIEDRGAGIFGSLKAPGGSISGGGYYSITSCYNGRDEVRSNSRSAACHKPSKLRHDGGEVKEEKKVMNVNADANVWGKRTVEDGSRCNLGVTIRYGTCFMYYGVNYEIREVVWIQKLSPINNDLSNS